VSRFPQQITFAVVARSALMLLLVGPPSQAQQAGGLNQQLFNAVGNRDLITVESLLRQGANIEAASTNGMRPLMSAAESGSVPLVSLLLENGANAGAKDNQGDTALTWAARGGWVKLISLLARFSDTKEKNRALFAAVEDGPVGVVEIDASTLPIPPPSKPAAEVEQSWTATAESLLDSGAEIEARNEDGSTPLIWAAQFAQTDIFELLKSRGAKIGVRDKYGDTPLIVAACECAEARMNSAYDVVRILLDEGADVNARSKDGTTALMNAASGFGDAAIVKLLLDHGANPKLKDRRGNTVLTLARKRQREDKVRLIREARASTN
jgi:ankyrin repeat protein